LVPHTIDVDEHGFAEALIASGRLSETEALHPELIKREIEAVVGNFIAGWRRHGVTRC
jgi:hypothetical protein